MSDRIFEPGCEAEDQRGVLEDAVSLACVMIYRPTSAEVAALRWLGDRYSISTYLLSTLAEEEDGSYTMRLDTFEVGAALSDDGVDRVPCLDESTTLAYLVWYIGPEPDDLE